MLGSDQILGKVIRLPFKLLPKGSSIPFVQKSLRGMKWIIGSGPHGCWLGTAEKEKRVIFEKCLRANNVVYDIGANVGYYSLMSSVGVGKNGTVHAFEPSPRNINFLKKHLEINHINNVTIHEVAVSDKVGTVHFLDDGDPVARRISKTGGLEIETVSIDILIDTNIIAPPQHIKIDVEGAELEVLRGAKNLLSKNKPELFVETHDCFKENIHQNCIDFLKELGYNVKELEYNGSLGEIYAST